MVRISEIGCEQYAAVLKIDSQSLERSWRPFNYTGSLKLCCRFRWSIVLSLEREQYLSLV